MNIDKIDIVMWTKNGSKTLPQVLNQINNVIPKKVVNKRFIIDDNSSDNTREIAKKFGWFVRINEGTGISDGANTALKQIESESFASFEQDLLLSPRWWPNVPNMLFDKYTAIASGTRFPTKPSALRGLLEYDLEHYNRNLEDKDPFHYGKTLDNTIYKTEIIKKVGGFPNFSANLSACVDTSLAKKIQDVAFKWKVNYEVKSLHMRDGLFDELHHFYWYGTQNAFLMPHIVGKSADAKSFLKTFLNSPKIGLSLALKLNCPELLYIYPLIQLYLYNGVVSGLKRRVCANR